VQESQHKTADAIANYRNAARYATDNIQITLNTNDAARLESPADLMSQSLYLQRNIDLATTSNTVPEQITARRQMADVRRAQQDDRGALEELDKALEEAESNENEAISFQIKQDIAQTLTATGQYDEAIGLNKQLVDEARRTNNPKVEVNQLQHLATSYFESGNPSGGITALQEAYRAALDKNLTLEAKSVLEQLVGYYRQQRNTAMALDTYAGFIGQLDVLIKNDSTLVDEQFFKMQEDKITQLEKERTLKDELLTKQNRYNNVLTGSIILILISLAVISKILYNNLRKNKRIALQSLRREMNPHFIFNSLNSVNLFIAENNEIEANKYLSAYSKLMRAVMENSNSDFIPLSTEIEQLRDYLALEQLRFKDKFRYTIQVDEALDTDSLMIPNMLVQPQLENAVWHGLRYKEEAGVLSLTVIRQGDAICFTVEDNGIGLKKSRELKTEHQKSSQSRGQTNTFERISLLNHLYRTKITMEIVDRDGGENGVTVMIRVPKLHRRAQRFQLPKEKSLKY
jgi:tetratricopeptide (TPR) repeat protein